jgi:hypothetical protein
MWWLHRTFRPDRSQPVAALFLWRSLASPEDGSGGRDRVDPVWWLRALVLAALALGLAGPRWSEPGMHAIDVWIDDRPSLLVREGERTRRDLLLEELAHAVHEVRPDRMRLRSLTSSGRILDLEPAHAGARIGDWLRAPFADPSPPAPLEMDRQIEHWLLSDGSHDGLGPWLATAPVTRVIGGGAETENVGVLGLAARRALDDPGRIDGLARVRNGGERVSTRTLVFRLGAHEIGRESLSLAPGEVADRSVRFVFGALPPLTAEIRPSDALTADDSLDLDLLPFTPAAVRLDGSCPPPLAQVLAAHPGVRVVDRPGDRIDLDLACPGSGALAAGPAIRFLPIESPEKPLEPAVWLGEAAPHPLDLASDLLRTDPSVRFPPGVRPLLVGGERTLIAWASGPPATIDVALDVASAPLTGRPEFPALIGRLLDLALQRDLVDPVALVRRPETAAVIAPRRLEPSAAAAAETGARHIRDLTPYIIGGAILLALVEFVRGSRQGAPVPRRRRAA